MEAWSRAGIFPPPRPGARTMLHRQRNGRAPVLAQVEDQQRGVCILGRAQRLGAQGLCIGTPDTLAEGTVVVVRFFLPSDRSQIEAAGRVVRCEPGRSISVTFLGLTENHGEKLRAYLRTLPPEKLFQPPEANCEAPVRRSGRLDRRIAAILNWRDEQGQARQEAVETVRLSRHGAVILAFSPLPPGQLVRVTTMEGKSGSARVVWSEPAQQPGRTAVALEFIGTENLWELHFPLSGTESAEPALPARRRSGRLPRKMNVVLSWMDDRGQPQKQTAETRLLSKYGALLAAPVPMRVGARFRLCVPTLQREAESRVVWTRPDVQTGCTDIGLEFVGEDNFWGVAFPPAGLSPHLARMPLLEVPQA